MLLPILIALLISPDVRGDRVIDTTHGVTILAVEDEAVNLHCKMNIPITDCGFIHPSGTKYSFSDPGLNDGRCTVKVKATKINSGEWRCHIGRDANGVESIQYIQVRVVGQVAAILPNVTAVFGQPITLECATANMTPLSYCSYEPPNGGAPFSISPAVTSIDPILDRYYYPLNKSLDRGECAVTIRQVEYDDVGLWTCGAGLDEDGKKHTDVINLDVEGLHYISAASAIGIMFGAIGIAVLLLVLGIVVWKKRRFLGTFMQKEPEIIQIQELGPRPRRPINSRVSPQPKRNIPFIIIRSPSK